MTNPILSFFEWMDEALGGSSAPSMCQWRSAVMPSEALTISRGMSPLLEASHVKQVKTDDDEKDPFELPRSAPTIEAERFYEPYTLEMADGSLVSFLQVRGTRTIMREVDIATRATEIGRRLAKSLETRLHSYGVHFLHDPMSAAAQFDQKIAATKATAERFGGDATEMIADMKSRITRGAAEEMMLMTIRTHPAGLRPDERKRMGQEYAATLKSIEKIGKTIKGRPLALFSQYGQAMLTRSAGLLKRHESAVVNTLQTLNDKNVNIAAMLLSTREALSLVRRFADRETPMGVAMPMLTGSSGSTAHAESYQNSFAPLSLGMQVLKRKVTGYLDSVEVSRIGNMYYGTAVMMQGTASPRNDPTSTLFSEFLSAIRAKEIPVAVSYDLLAKGMNFNGMNRLFNGIIGGVGGHNRQIKAAYTELKEYEEKHSRSDPIIGLRMQFTTWATTKEGAERALSELVFAAQGWGGMDVNADLGAPDHAKVSAIPEFSAASRAPIVPVPFQDALYLTTLTRAASPWEEGQLVLKTSDGVLYPFALGSSHHASFVTGIAAPSGSGKSVFLNRLHSAIALSPGLKQLPYITVIDVAPSAEGTLRNLRMVLPQKMHSQLAYFKVINSADKCVNPMDLQLGCIRPTEMAKDFIKAVLEIIFDGMGPESGRLINALIDNAYAHYAPSSPSAKKWQESYDDRVATALREIGYETIETTTAWDVTDALFAAAFDSRGVLVEPRMIDLAVIAQRFAVPTIAELPTILMSERISSTFATAPAITGEMVQPFANRALQEAAREFAVLAGVTRMDLDQARIKVIDLQSAVGSSSTSGVRYAGMMYLYARQLGAGNYFLDVPDIREICQPQYLKYQIARVREIKATPKVLSYDEWHYVRSLKGLVDLNEAEVRTTRKFGIYLNFVTQYVSDLPPAILAGATTLLVVGAASPEQNRSMGATLGLSQSEIETLDTGIDQVGKIFAWFKLRDGNTTALLLNDVGPLEMWCYTTDDKDAPLRNELIELIGERPALRLLAKTFHTGRATAFLAKRAREMGVKSGDGDEMATVSAAVAREMAAAYNARMEA